MPLAPGDVVRVFDRTTRPAKAKRMICVDPERQYFLRINTKPKWPPHHRIDAADADFLDHDSYVELRQLVRPYAYEIQSAELLGHLTRQQVAALVAAVLASATLPQDHKDLIAEQLG